MAFCCAITVSNKIRSKYLQYSQAVAPLPPTSGDEWCDVLCSITQSDSPACLFELGAMSFSHSKYTDQNEGGACSGVFLNNIATPCVVVSTYIGNPSYTTPDVLDESQTTYLGQLEIADVCQKDFKSIPLGDLKRETKNCTLILSSRNMVTPAASCDANGISIDTFGGRHHINVNGYVSRMALDKPKVIIAIADEVC